MQQQDDSDVSHLPDEAVLRFTLFLCEQRYDAGHALEPFFGAYPKSYRRVMGYMS